MSCCRDLTKAGILYFTNIWFLMTATMEQQYRQLLLWRHCQQKTAANVRNLGFCGLPWESDSFSASQAIHWFLWKPKVHYRIHNSRPILSSLTHVNPVDVRLSHSVSGPILILSFHLHPGLPHVSPPKSCTQLYPPRTGHRPICLTPLDLITRTISGEQHKSRSSSLCNCLQSL